MFQTKQQWVAPKWKNALEKTGLLNIEAVAKREFEWFEAPNRRRGGWSGVTRMVLNPNAVPEQRQVLFLKIQQNHFYRAASTCFRKRLTFQREFEALQALTPAVKCLPNLVLYSQWEHNGTQGAIIVTEALEGLQPFDKWLRHARPRETQSTKSILKALQSIATAAREIHLAGWAHFGFYPKHAFIAENANEDYIVRLIDWEKARQPSSSAECSIEDVSRFLRHSTELNNDEKVAYLRYYFQTQTFTSSQKRIIHKMRGVPVI